MIRYAEAQQIKQELEQLVAQAAQLESEQNHRSNLEEQTLLRCLLVLKELLENSVESIEDYPGIAGLKDTIILPAVQHSNPVVRNYAILALGFYSLLSA